MYKKKPVISQVFSTFQLPKTFPKFTLRIHLKQEQLRSSILISKRKKEPEHPASEETSINKSEYPQFYTEENLFWFKIPSASSGNGL